ncbi:MAG TPA: selenocysteine-specific translation elongation factor [Gemmatimonadaceae bacterium]|nr:selenocysteine-specific translation elongation factor [Gemmatimonadaceae bacterium]
MIIGTAGHIDHGKTTLVRALTGVDTDRLPEEKRRGITIELGFAPLSLDGIGTVGIVDVPGHEAFVRTMVAGATGIDVAVLVIAADEGVMPQTREHVSILTLLGTRAGVVALTKCDLVDEEWLSLVTADVDGFLQGTALDGAPIIRTSAATGAGLAELRAALGDVIRSLPDRDERDTFRLPIDRAFSVRGTGTVVTGTVWEGSVATGDSLLLQPGGKSVRVRGVQAHSADVARAGSGTRAALAITGVEVADVERGAWLSGDPKWPVTTLLRAEVSLIPAASRPLGPREWVRFHLGTADVGARVVAKGGPLQPGEHRAVRLVLQEPVLARAGDRFVLRQASPGATIGGGVVVDPLPPRRRASPWERLADPEVALGRILLEAAVDGGADAAVLPARLGLSPVAMRALLARDDLAVSIAGRVHHPAAVAAAREAVERMVQEGLRVGPLGEGLSAALLPSLLPIATELVQRAVDDLAAAGRIERRGAHLTTPGWQPVISAEDGAFKLRILARLQAAGAEPPDIHELAGELGRDPIPFLRLLEREHCVTPVEPGRFYAVQEVERLVTKLRGGMTEGREYSPSELRDVLGLSRKYLIPFLEYCDRMRITERRATGRVRVSSTA